MMFVVVWPSTGIVLQVTLQLGSSIKRDAREAFFGTRLKEM